jgi:NADH:ubiquinone oxidoreductase subunit 6 (subunit J)
MFEVVNHIFFSSLSLSFVLSLVSYCTLLYSNKHCPTGIFLSLPLLSVYCLAIFLSHRLLHHQRTGSLQYIYYIGYVVVIVVTAVEGVDGGEEDREREREKLKVYYITQMYVFVLFLIITLFFLFFALLLSYKCL